QQQPDRLVGGRDLLRALQALDLGNRRRWRRGSLGPCKVQLQRLGADIEVGLMREQKLLHVVPLPRVDRHEVAADHLRQRGRGVAQTHPRRQILAVVAALLGGRAARYLSRYPDFRRQDRVPLVRAVVALGGALRRVGDPGGAEALVPGLDQRGVVEREISQAAVDLQTRRQVLAEGLGRRGPEFGGIVRVGAIERGEFGLLRVREPRHGQYV